MNRNADTDDQALARLQTDFPGHRVWRAVRGDGRLGLWVATLCEPTAGVDRTLVCQDPTGLREALKLERERAESRMEIR